MAALLHSPPQTESEIGGKARALTSLQNAGFPVPKFTTISDPDPASICAAARALDPTATHFAVRSSAAGEDSAAQSFAGQFDSFLRVPLTDLPKRYHDVLASAQNARLQTYQKSKAGTGTESTPPKVSVILQLMVNAGLSGVAFTADPVTGDRATTLISATTGTAEHLVSGTVDGETFRVSASDSVDSPPAPKTLTHQQARQVAALARRCESHFGAPQDIEWAIADGELYLLQSRPITTLKTATGGQLRIWDNSNIAESYSGITSPLTFTFASRAYASVYRQFCRIMGVPKKRVAESAEVFDNMLGHIRGRVFYNLVNWYHVLALLPGFKTNRNFMEQMMGVKVPMPDEIIAEVEAKSSVGKFRDKAHVARTLTGLLANLARHRRAVKKFHRHLDDALTSPQKSLSKMSAGELIAHYHELEEKLLQRWDTPLVNDFFAMIFFGLLKKKSTAWLNDQNGSLANRLIRDTGASTSIEPPRLVRELAAQAAANPSLQAALETATTAEDLAQFPGFHTALTDYLNRFGERCLSELKLESPTLHDDATPLLKTVHALSLTNPPEQNLPCPKDDPESAVASLPFFRRQIFKRILAAARDRLRDRENLRYGRTRVFGRVRNIMRHLGEHYAAEKRLHQPDDIFYLTVEEAIGQTPFTAESAKSRRAEFVTLTNTPPPPDRFETRGDNLNPPRSHFPSTDDSLTGVGASPGIVRGIARVITDPHGTHLRPGEILVAQQTDPGWVVLFPAAAGIVVERGSLLSHSAIVAREMGIPAIVSLTRATQKIPTGTEIEIDGTTGQVTLLPHSK